MEHMKHGNFEYDMENMKHMERMKRHDMETWSMINIWSMAWKHEHDGSLWSLWTSTTYEWTWKHMTYEACIGLWNMEHEAWHETWNIRLMAWKHGNETWSISLWNMKHGNAWNMNMTYYMTMKNETWSMKHIMKHEAIWILWNMGSSMKHETWNMETWNMKHLNMTLWKHEHASWAWKHGSAEAWKHGSMRHGAWNEAWWSMKHETWTHRTWYVIGETWNGQMKWYETWKRRLMSMKLKHGTWVCMLMENGIERHEHEGNETYRLWRMMQRSWCPIGLWSMKHQKQSNIKYKHEELMKTRNLW
jgi:hypothetical protein